MRISRSAVLVSALVAFASTGCLMGGSYHSAKTLGKGESATGLTFSAITYEFEDGIDGTTDRITLPSFVPDVTYHIGITDDVEAGGRVALGSFGLEADFKWRFYHDAKLHLAVAPALAYQGFVILQGTTVRLPLVATYDLADNFGLNFSLFGANTNFETVDNDDDDFGVWDGNLVATGAAIGFDLRGETLAIRPAVEVTRYVADFDDGDDFEGFNTFNIMVHVAWIGGREKKQLNRMEEKLDRVLDGGGGAGGTIAPGAPTQPAY